MFTCRCFNISILHVHIQKQILCKFPLYINVELVAQHKHIKYEKYENGVYHTITNFYKSELLARFKVLSKGTVECKELYATVPGTLLAIELFCRVNPSGLRVDGYGKVLRGGSGEVTRPYRVLYLSVRALVGIVRLYPQHRVPNRHVLRDRLLKVAGVKSRCVVVDVAYVH